MWLVHSRKCLDNKGLRSKVRMGQRWHNPLQHNYKLFCNHWPGHWLHLRWRPIDTWKKKDGILRSLYCDNLLRHLHVWQCSVSDIGPLRAWICSWLNQLNLQQVNHRELSWETSLNTRHDVQRKYLYWHLSGFCNGRNSTWSWRHRGKQGWLALESHIWNAGCNRCV